MGNLISDGHTGTNHVLPSDQDLPESISILRNRGKLERVATFRQLQALSNAIRSLGHWQGLGDFKLPSDWSTVRPIEPDEVRVVREGAMLDRALLVNLRTRQANPMLPDSALASQDALLAATQGINLLVLGLDQGTTGVVGYAYPDSMGALNHVKRDKFHRVIRDINLAVEHSCNGM